MPRDSCPRVVLTEGVVMSAALVRRAALVFGILALAVGCAPIHYVSTPQPMAELDRFEVLEIAPIASSQDVVEISDESLAALRENFVKKFGKDKLMHQVVSSTDDSIGVCLMRCDITHFDKGSSAARFFFGFGAGKAKMTMHVALIDKTRGSVLGETDVSGTVTPDFWNRIKAEKAGKQMEKYISKFVKKRGQGGKSPSAS